MNSCWMGMAGGAGSSAAAATASLKHGRLALDPRATPVSPARGNAWPPGADEMPSATIPAHP
eukprot:6785297-Lingulodinium_polyedra.AAC.1